MLFNSYEFIFLFLPAILLGFYGLAGRSHTVAAGFLALASLFFYGWWSWQALPLLLVSIVFNFAMGGRVAPSSGASERRRAGMLRAALAVNLAVLGLFKYADFFVGNANSLLAQFGHAPWPLLHWVLPIGISFYTFTQIAYLVDCAQGKVQERRFVHYLLFVTYFPHLIAGPVLHHAQMMPQFARDRTYHLGAQRLALGLAIFVLGLSKKLLIADPLGQAADLVFDQVHAGLQPSPEIAWTGVLAYTFQIYFDFSGYSDMAVGISACLGVRLPQNFRSPYKADSIIEFWRRWHISLSTFLRDYLYIPLGGNRHGKTRRHVNLMLTMLLGGLWHGAAWTFVLWGAIHGSALAINHGWQSLRRRWWPTTAPSPAWRAVAVALTFLVVALAWVVFRAPDVATALAIYRGLFMLGDAQVLHLTELSPSFKLHELYRVLLAAMLIAWTLPRSTQWAASMVPTPSRLRRLRCLGERRAAVLGGLGFGLLLVWSVSRLGAHSAFLYFQF
ncbi:MAG: hypothetical protein RIQ60_3474 [Pseudomonadota bacterium]|jgi:alginate O-acetyltransferase complex protein AlgI